jgi:hypothetical protein
LQEHRFLKITAAHEFGHLLGLEHPHCEGGAPDCYGVTPQEAMDVMGLGSYVSLAGAEQENVTGERVLGRDLLAMLLEAEIHARLSAVEMPGLGIVLPAA